MLKSEVRDIAKKLELSVSSKKDSVGICFVGEKNMKDFIGRFIELKKGPIFDENNNKVGEHNGATLYTKGQRQGLNIGGVKGKKDLPWYVYDKNIKNNEIYVCQGLNNKLLFSKSLECESISWINDSKINFPINCYLQVRHQHSPVKCEINKTEKGFKIIFKESIRGVAPGQSAVFYNDNICLGGGVISKSI